MDIQTRLANIEKQNQSVIKQNALILKKLYSMDAKTIGFDLKSISLTKIYRFSELVKIAPISTQTLWRDAKSGKLKVNKDKRSQVLGRDFIEYWKNRSM